MSKYWKAMQLINLWEQENKEDLNRLRPPVCLREIDPKLTKTTCVPERD